MYRGVALLVGPLDKMIEAYTTIILSYFASSHVNFAYNVVITKVTTFLVTYFWSNLVHMLNFGRALLYRNGIFIVVETEYHHPAFI